MLTKSWRYDFWCHFLCVIFTHKSSKWQIGQHLLTKFLKKFFHRQIQILNFKMPCRTSSWDIYSLSKIKKTFEHFFCKNGIFQCFTFFNKTRFLALRVTLVNTCWPYVNDVNLNVLGACKYLSQVTTP